VGLTTYEGLVQRTVFYACELYAGQVKSREEYETVNPVYTIWLINGILWPDTTRLHHAFRLTDKESGRVLEGTVEQPRRNLARPSLTHPTSASGRHAECAGYHGPPCGVDHGAGTKVE
jgi:hypothetical protein